MRLHPTFLLSLLAATPPLAAQSPARSFGWSLGAGVETVRFGHVASSQAAPGAAAEVRPSARPAFHASIGRSYGSVSVQLEAGWAGGHIEAGNDVISVQDRTSSVTRYRLALALERRVASAGPSTLLATLAPTMDLWSVAGDGRLRAGAEGRLVLRIPLGTIELENRLGIGLSGNPIEASDIGEVSELRGLRTMSVGMGLRFGT